MRIKSLLSACLLAWSVPSSALTVDKMVIIPSKEVVVSEIKVNNPDPYPVFFKVSLSEMMENGEIVPFDVDDFESWAVYLDRDGYIIEQGDEVTVNVQLLAKQLGKPIENDRIIAIDITPESISGSSESEQSVSILFGYRVWMILSKDGEVKGRTEVVKTKDGYSIKNNSDSVALVSINACDTEFEKDKQCKGQEFVLSGKEKPLNFTGYKNGDVTITTRDPYNRYKMTHTVKL